MDLNSVSLTARLTRDPEGRTTPSGTSVCRMRIAVNGFTGNGEPKADYLDLVVFGRQVRQRFYPAASDLVSTASLIIELGARTDVYVGAAPRGCRHGGRAAIEKVWCLWVDCDGPRAVAELGRFAPAPAIVVSSGSAANVHAYWPLRRPIGPQEAEVANRRLAHAVTADPASTEPARILRPLSVARRIWRSVCAARSFADAGPSEAVMDGGRAR